MARLGSVADGAKELSSNRVLRLSKHAHHVRMDDQIIVADMRSGRYFGLDDVGAMVWSLIEERATPAVIVDRVHAEYDVSRDVLERDVDRLLDDLLERRLVEYATDTAAAES